MPPSELSGRNLVVWGYGREGQAAAEYAERKGASVRIAVTDGPAPNSAPRKPGQPLLVGDQAVEALCEAELVVKSPGIQPNDLYYRMLSAGVEITSGTELWLAERASQTFAVTGSKGKSTTATLLSCALRNLGSDVVLGGNMGTPLLSLRDDAEYYVVELSSYQCESVRTSPRWVVLTSLFPDHLDWHGSVEQYYQDKLNLIRHGCDRVVANGYDEALRSQVARHIEDARVVWTGPSSAAVDQAGGVSLRGDLVLKRNEIPLAGLHNVRNVALVVAMVDLALADGGLGRESVLSFFDGFSPLKHRLERTPSRDGRRWVDDGLSTAPEATLAALEVYADDAVTLILGGADRGLSYDLLQRYLERRSKAVTILTVPESGERIAATLGNLRNHTVIRCASFTEALNQSDRLAPVDSVILLSPGAPSFGEFRDFEHRSEVFRKFAGDAAPPSPRQSGRMFS